MVAVEELSPLVPKPLLDRLAVSLQVNAPNQVRLPGQTVFVCLLNCLANHPIVTQRLLEETAMELTGHSVDHSSFGKRLASLSPEYFEAIFVHLYRKVSRQMTRGDQQALRLRFVDATTVTLSAKLIQFGIRVSGRAKGRAPYDKRHLKSVLELSEEGLPQLLHLCREQREANDNPALGDPILAAAAPGDLFVFDTGCFDRDRLLRLHQTNAYFLTPHKNQGLRTLQILWEAKEGADAGSAPPAAPPAPAGASTARVETPGRLLRVELAVFENSNDASSPARQAKWAQLPLLVLYAERWDLRSQQWKPLVLLTNLPLSEDEQAAGPFSFAELLEVYRRRWGIELLFKFLKQHLSYDHLTSRCENGIRVMVLMALITAVLLIWYQRKSGIDRGWRSVKFWFAHDVREWTEQRLRQAWETARGGRGSPGAERGG